MREVRLGVSGLLVSEVGFGGIPLTRVDEDEAVRLVRRAVELGITFFDTANMYGDSEAKMGSALAPVRDRVVIATKTMARDAATAREHLQQSLERLKTDRIDLYQLHNVARREDLEQVLAPGGAYEVAAEARERGQVRAIGFSSHHPDVAREAMATGKFSTVQFAFNFLENDSLTKVFGPAQEVDLGCIGMKPLGGGLLERGDLCFKFLQTHPQVVPIPGIQAMSELEEIASLYEERPALTEADHQAMAAIRQELGQNFCHRCGYCQPCPEGVSIPWILIFHSQSRRFPPETVKNLSGKAMETFAACQECGECEEKCPYDLPVTTMLAEAKEAYEAYVAAL